MKTNNIKQKLLLAMTLVNGVLVAGASSNTLADDGQIYSAWECRASGSPGQTSDSYLEYRHDGSVANYSSNYSINVVCPVRTKPSFKFLEYTSVDYTDNHPDRNVRCNLYVETSSGRKVFMLDSPSGIRSANLLIRNTANSGTRSWLSCTIPPVHSGKKSAIHAYRANFNDDDYDCGWRPVCFDPTGVALPWSPGHAARFMQRNLEAKPFISSAGSYLANFSYDYVLPVVYPIARDKLSEHKAPHVNVRAKLTTDNIGLAQCRLVQTTAGSNVSFDLAWRDPDGDGSGVFSGTGNDSLVNSSTAFSVHCDIPPRTSAGYSRVDSVGVSE